MKSKWAKLISALVLVAMVLTGCSSGNGSTETGGTETGGETAKTIPTSDVVKGETNQQTYPLVEEKITFNYWFPHGSSMANLADYNDGEFWQWYEELTN